jgi:hypothetical protein
MDIKRQIAFSATKFIKKIIMSVKFISLLGNVCI